MAKRTIIRGADIVTMDADAGRLRFGRHPDRGRRDRARSARRSHAARCRDDRRHRHDRPAGHHRCPHLPVADRAARLRARPVARHLQHQAAAAARRATRRRTISTPPMSARFEMLSYGTTTVVDYCHNISGPDYAPRSIEALKTTGIRHLFELFVHDVPAGQLSRSAARFDDARRDLRHASTIPTASPPSASASNSIGSPDISRAARLRARPQGAELHPCQRDRHDRQAAMPRACSGPTSRSIHGNLISNAELEHDGQGAHAALLHADRRHARHAGRRRAPRPRPRRRRGVRLRHPLLVASDTLGQLRVMFNVQGFLDGAMERSFSTVLGRRPAVRPGMPLLTPRKLIEIATITAARVLGLDDRIGSLTPGKRADIVLIAQGPVRRFDRDRRLRPRPAADQPARHRHGDGRRQDPHAGRQAGRLRCRTRRRDGARPRASASSGA